MGAEKGNFLIRDAEADEATGRPRQWNPVNPCPRGVPGVAQGRYYTRTLAVCKTLGMLVSYVPLATLAAIHRLASLRAWRAYTAVCKRLQRVDAAR